MEVVSGRFNDGRTAAARAVQVTVTLAGLEIRGGDGLLVAFWQRGDLREDGGPPGGQGLRLRCAKDEAARLSLDDTASIRPLLPGRSRRAMPWRAITLSTAAIALLGVGLWQGIPAGARLLVNAVPLPLEQRWGDHLANGLQQRWGTCETPAGEAALGLLSARLAAGMPPPLRPRRVVVVRTDLENAIALPGGTVMIFNGLLKNAADGDEVAGVLAHEFAHLTHRHPTAAMIRAMGLGVVVMLVTGDASGVLATGTAMALGGAYSREDETAADQGGIALLKQANLSPRGLSAFFRRLGKEKGVLPAWISTHPDSGARADMVDALAPEGKTLPALTPEQWTALKGICG